MLAHGFRVGTASGIIFSSWLASGELTTPLQLHVGLQYFGRRLEHLAKGAPPTVAKLGKLHGEEVGIT